MRAILLTIGDELLIGQVVNTNAAWLGEQLSLLGVDLVRVVTLGDEVAAIRDELDHAYAEVDLVLLTGGLGPTHDDITRDVVATYFEASLHLDPTVLERIQQRFQRRKRTMPESSRSMALVPEGFDALTNSVGAAPGLWRIDTTHGEPRIVVVMPGVPGEMKAIFQEEIMPRLRAQQRLRVMVHRTLLTVGIGESTIQEKLGDLSALLGPGLGLAFLPHVGGVRLRLTATGSKHTEVANHLARLESYLRRHLDAYIFGMDDDSLEAILGRVLNERGLTLAVAESCTGGLILHRLTNVPGSSAYVEGGVVAYANAVKEQMLGVEADALEREGAVSEIVACQMAQGVRLRLGAAMGLATTGVAGPSGGTPDKPVGTVWIGYSDAESTFAQQFHFGQHRAKNKERSCIAALDLVRRHMLKQERDDQTIPATSIRGLNAD